MTRRFASPTLLAAAALLALPAGCRRMTGDEGLAEDANDSLEVSADEGSLLMISTDPAPMAFGGADGALAAAAAAGAAGKYLLPAGCVTATASGSTTTYVYNDCTGPHGLIHVTGTLTVDFDRQADGLHVHAVATGLRVNGGTLDIDTNAIYSLTAAGKQLVVSTKKHGVGPRGRAFDHAGDYTFSWVPDTRCHTLDGKWSTAGAARGISTTVAGYARCPASCPSAGTITHTGLGGKTVTITFDGSATAHWSTSGGRSGSATLFCSAK